MKNVSPHAISGASLPAPGRTMSTPANVSAMYRMIDASSIGAPLAWNGSVPPRNAAGWIGPAHGTGPAVAPQGTEPAAPRFTECGARRRTVVIRRPTLHNDP